MNSSPASDAESNTSQTNTTPAPIATLMNAIYQANLSERELNSLINMISDHRNAKRLLRESQDKKCDHVWESMWSGYRGGVKRCVKCRKTEQFSNAED